MPTRDESFALLQQHVKSDRLIKHCLATEVVMKALARKLGQDEEKWGTAGLLHDLDVEMTATDLSLHGKETGRILGEKGYDPDIIDAIVMHNEQTGGPKRSQPFHHALAAGETVTGLIVATTLVYPDKKLASVKPSSVVKRMKEKLFAASVNRDTIRECEKIGIPLDEFAVLAIDAMRGISGQLGL